MEPPIELRSGGRPFNSGHDLADEIGQARDHRRPGVMEPGPGLPRDEPGLQRLSRRRGDEGHEIGRGGDDALLPLRRGDDPGERISIPAAGRELRHDRRRHEVEGHQLAVDMVEGSSGGATGIFEHPPPDEILPQGQLREPLPGELPRGPPVRRFDRENRAVVPRRLDDHVVNPVGGAMAGRRVPGCGGRGRRTVIDDDRIPVRNQPRPPGERPVGRAAEDLVGSQVLIAGAKRTGVEALFLGALRPRRSHEHTPPGEWVDVDLAGAGIWRFRHGFVAGRGGGSGKYGMPDGRRVPGAFEPSARPP